MNPYTPNALLLRVHDDLKPWVASEKGHLSIARDPFDVIELLGANPPGFNILLLWEGDEDFLDQPLAGIVRHNISVVVSSNRGLRMWKGENLHRPGPGQPALLDRVDQVRQRIRALRLEDEVTDQIFLYKGCEPESTPDGLPLDAYRLRFQIHAAIPHIHVL
jgi:hypothetical protein